MAWKPITVITRVLYCQQRDAQISHQLNLSIISLRDIHPFRVQNVDGMFTVLSWVFSFCDARFSISNEALIVVVSYKTSIIYSNNLKQTNLFGYWLIFLLCKCHAFNKLHSGGCADKNSLKTPNLKTLGSAVCVGDGKKFLCILRRAQNQHKRQKVKWMCCKDFVRGGKVSCWIYVWCSRR